MNTHHLHVFIKLLQTVWLIQTFGSNGEEDVSRSHCTTMSNVITCNGSVPVLVPLQVNSVEILILNQEHFDAITTTKWTHIKYLTLKCVLSENDTVEILTIPRSTFKHFVSLKVLSISCRQLRSVSEDVFLGLDSLTVLDLSDCYRIGVTSVTAALKGNKLLSLQQLNLRCLSLFLTTTLHFSKEFFYSLRNKPIRQLDISGTKYGTMHIQAFSESLPQLREFNVSEGGFVAINLLKALYDYPENFHKLRIVDLSYPTLTETFFHPSTRGYWQSKIPPTEMFVQNLTSITVQGFVLEGIRTRLVGLDLAQKICTLIVIMPNNVTLITFCLLKDKGQKVSLQRLDFARSGLEDIDPSLTSRAVYIKYVDLSHNHLNLMVSSRLEQSLHHTKNLVEFYISHNSLSYVPLNMFVNTIRIEIIDLSNNNLESVTFKLSHLHYLRVLRLDHNKIHTVYSQRRMSMDQLIHARIIQIVNGSSIGNSLVIDMRTNPIACSCDNKDFVEWVTTTSEIQFSSVCSLQGASQSVHHKAMSKIDVLCKRPLIIGSCVAAGSVLLIIGAIICVGCLRRRNVFKKKRHLTSLIEKYRVSGNFKYPVFLSYSSADEDFIAANVVGEMNARLQVLLKTSKNCVATGDTTFRPGFYVLEEVIKWIECSEVVILCISKSFCKSPWCKDEMFVSKYQHKPIVLIFLEEVKTSEMPKVLHTYFSNTTRSKWVTEGDGAKLVPSWDTVCQSIVELMTLGTTLYEQQHIQSISSLS